MGGNIDSMDGIEDEIDVVTSSNYTLNANNTAVNLKRRKRQIDFKSKDNIVSKSTYIPLSSETLYINCSRSEVICGIIKCKSSSFLTTFSLFKLRLSMEVDIASLGEYHIYIILY